ncbi:IS3 family transposase, partial [Escherichia coli]|nr:IS3 family transposase [Escherichia coli]
AITSGGRAADWKTGSFGPYGCPENLSVRFFPNSAGSPLRALNMALALRKPPPGCIQHTDRGSQYCAHEYQKLLLKHQLLPSMSGKGNCFDNSAVESFFKSLKAELIWRRHWQTRRDIEIAIFEYINGFYNPRRRHSTLGWKSPVAFEKKAA